MVSTVWADAANWAFWACRSGGSQRVPGVPRANSGAIAPPPLPDFRVLDREYGDVPRAQSFRQFRQSIQDSGVSGDNPSGSGFLTPRSGVRGEGAGFDASGYPVSPGGTVIRPPPGPPPTSPRGGHIGAGCCQGQLPAGGAQVWGGLRSWIRYVVEYQTG